MIGFVFPHKNSNNTINGPVDTNKNAEKSGNAWRSNKKDVVLRVIIF